MVGTNPTEPLSFCLNALISDMVFTMVNCRTLIKLPPLAGGSLEGGGFHPHLNPLPSRERNFIRDCAINYTCISLTFSLQLFDKALIHAIGLFCSGETARFNLGYITGDCGLHLSGQPGILLGMLGHEFGIEAQKIADDLDLTVTIRSSPDADCRDRQLLSNQFRKRCRSAFQNDCKSPGLLQNSGIVEQLSGLLEPFTAHPKPSQLVDGLRSKPNMPHNRDSTANKASSCLRDHFAALQFHRLRPPFLNKLGCNM